MFFKIYRMLAVTSLIGVAWIFGCGEKTPTGTGDDRLIGTWDMTQLKHYDQILIASDTTQMLSITFREDLQCTIISTDYSNGAPDEWTGTSRYSVSGNTITFADRSGSKTDYYSITGANLTLIEADSLIMEFIRR